MLLETEAHRATADIVGLSVVVGTMAQWLPPIAALVTIVVGLIRVWESKTVQGWLGREAPPASD